MHKVWARVRGGRVGVGLGSGGKEGRGEAKRERVRKRERGHVHTHTHTRTYMIRQRLDEIIVDAPDLLDIRDDAINRRARLPPPHAVLEEDHSSLLALL